LHAQRHDDKTVALGLAVLKQSCICISTKIRAWHQI